MELKGIVVQVLEAVTGEGKNGTWQKQQVIIEVATDSKYPKMVALVLWGDMVNKCRQGEVITAHIDIESRDYNGRWYTDVKAWKIEVQQQAGVQAELPIDEPLDDLPF